MRAFERHYGFVETGSWSSIVPSLNLFHDRGCLPVRTGSPIGPASPAGSPAEPSWDGATPLGDTGGRGSLRPDRLPRRIKVIDMAHEAQHGSAGTLHAANLLHHFSTDSRGEAVLWLPRRLDRASLRLDDGREHADVRLCAAQDDLDFTPRLTNLGFKQSSPLEAYQEHRGSRDIRPLKEEVEAWHDHGIRPNYNGDEAFGTRGTSSTPLDATVRPSPRTTVMKGAPTKSTTRSGNTITEIHLWKGQHCALEISALPKSRYPSLMVTNEKVLPNAPPAFSDVEKDGKRFLYFHASRTGRSTGTDKALIEVQRGGPLVMVTTHEHRPGLLGWLVLQTPGATTYAFNSKALEAREKKSKAYYYTLGHNRAVGLHEDFGGLMVEAAKHAEQHGGTIDHLVFNGHGRIGLKRVNGRWVQTATGRGWLEIGTGLDISNVGDLLPLQGKVRYVWVQACAIGGDNDLLIAMADLLQCTVVMGLQPYTMVKPLKPGGIDYDKQVMPTAARGFAGDEPAKMLSPSVFFEAARRQVAAGEFARGLDFYLESFHRVVRKRITF